MAKKQNKTGQHLITHGAGSKSIRKRYSDLRTTEGKQLANILNNLIEDLGGQANISSRQRLLINTNVRPKLITLLQISKYIDKQETLISEEGRLLPVLAQNYVTFSEALRRDLQALTDMSSNSKPPSLDEYLRKTYGQGIK